MALFPRVRAALTGSSALTAPPVEVIDSPSLHERLHAPSLPAQRAGYEAGDSHGGSAGAASDLGGWTPAPQSADLDIQEAGESVLGRVTDLTQNSAHESGAMMQHAAGIVGPHGLKLSSRPNWRVIPGASEGWAREFAATVEAEWRAVTGSDMNSLDRRRKMNWPAMNAVMVRTMMLHGEVLIAFEPRPKARPGEHQTAFRLIDPARLSDPRDNPTAMRERTIRQGLELDAAGEPVAVWLSTHHPRDVSDKRGGMKQVWTRHAIWGRDGRQRIGHFVLPERAEQTRGISPLAASLRAARMLKRTEDATLQSAILQATMALVIKSGADWKDVMEVLGATSSDPAGDGVEQFQRMAQEFMATRMGHYALNKPALPSHNARAIHLLPGESLETVTPDTANIEVATFLKELRAGVAANHGLGLAEYTGDFSKVNFSAAKVSGAWTARVQEMRRNQVIAPACRWMFVHFVEELLIRRPALLPREASFYDHRAALTASEWAGPPMIEPDPAKAANAAKIRLDSGVSSLEAEAARNGLDYEELLQQQARELRLKKELGLFELEAEQNAARTAQLSTLPGQQEQNPDALGDEEQNEQEQNNADQ